MPIQAINPVLEGMLHAYGVANQLRHAALEQHQLELHQQGLQFQKDLHEYNIGHAMLAEGGREATPADTAEAQVGVRFDPQASSPGFLAGGIAPSDIGQRMLRSPGGKTYVTLGPEERAKRHLQSLVAEKAAVGQVENTNKLALLTGENQLNRVEIPGVGPVSRYAVPYYASRENNQRAEQIAQANREAANARNAASNEAANARNAASNTSREKAAGIRAARKAAELTPGQAALQGRFDQREIDSAANRHDAAQEKEQTLHTQRIEIGDALAVPDGETFLDPKSGKELTMNPLYRSRLTAQLGEATTKVAELQKRQLEIREKFGFGEFAPETKPAQRGTPQYKPGDVVTQGGKRYKVLGTNPNGTLKAEPLD